MSLKDISNFFGKFHCILLRPLKLMLILSIMHLRSWRMVLNPCLMVVNHSNRDQSETNIAILINISTSLDRDCNFFMKYASCLTVKGESSNIMICMHCSYQSLFKSFDSSDERNKLHLLIVSADAVFTMRKK